MHGHETAACQGTRVWKTLRDTDSGWYNLVHLEVSHNVCTVGAERPTIDGLSTPLEQHQLLESLKNADARLVDGRHCTDKVMTGKIGKKWPAAAWPRSAADSRSARMVRTVWQRDRLLTNGAAGIDDVLHAAHDDCGCACIQACMPHVEHAHTCLVRLAMSTGAGQHQARASSSAGHILAQG